MWSPNEKVWSPKWENKESNFWNTGAYSFTVKVMTTSSGDFYFQ